jgi:hypothetical protein
MEEMVRLTWKNFGWDENTGVPQDRLINELELNDLVG